jgi:dynactin-5
MALFLQTIVKPGCILRGDLAKIRVGRYCMVADNCVIRPPYQRFKGFVVGYDEINR